jgi:hypothetical protein
MASLTPSSVAAVEVGKLLRRSTEISEQSAQGRGTLDSKLRAGHSAVFERHGSCRETSAVHEVHAYIAGLEKRTRHQRRRLCRFRSLHASQMIWSAK